MKSRKRLASQLKNRIEVWKSEQIDTDIGKETRNILYKRIWADVIPTGGSNRSGSGETEYNDTNFKIRVRKTDIDSSNWIVFEGFRYDIKYILPDFNSNSFLEIYAVLRIE